jgi:hypothetical protein
MAAKMVLFYNQSKNPMAIAIWDRLLSHGLKTNHKILGHILMI